MLERKPSKVTGIALPKDWIESVTALLNQTYEKECDAQGRHFEVHGQIFPSELVVIFGFNPQEKDSSESSVSCFLSCDTADIATPDLVKTTQENFVLMAGMFFDEVFATEDWSDWEPNWQEVEWKDKKYFYKMTRENVTLTLEADRLLREANFVEDLEDFDDEDEDETRH